METQKFIASLPHTKIHPYFSLKIMVVGSVTAWYHYISWVLLGIEKRAEASNYCTFDAADRKI